MILKIAYFSGAGLDGKSKGGGLNKIEEMGTDNIDHPLKDYYWEGMKAMDSGCGRLKGSVCVYVYGHLVFFVDFWGGIGGIFIMSIGLEESEHKRLNDR